ncbi:hypothetical protein [Parabacteroides faecis]|uniref:hypothetical protein n=1 Tax=Parabacteroides faecis TaxID=1217282 RepID=UPI0035220974
MIGKFRYILVIVVFVGYIGYIIGRDYKYRYRFRDNYVIGSITGTSFPPFTVLEYKKGKKSFTGDHTDTLLIEFEEMPSDIFYRSLDSLVNEGVSGWSVSNVQYRYSIVWGNGLPAPLGENDDEDAHLNIILTKGHKRAEIRYGSW